MSVYLSILLLVVLDLTRLPGPPEITGPHGPPGSPELRRQPIQKRIAASLELNKHSIFVFDGHAGQED